MMVYAIYIMLVSCAMISVAVDYGRMQMIKSQEQRSADAVARGLLVQLLSNSNAIKQYGLTNYVALQYLIQLGYANKLETGNPVDAGSGIAATYQMAPGAWDGTTFHPNTAPTSSWPLAIEVIVSRTVATGNPVPLAFPLPSGKTFITRTCDVWAKSVAVLPNTVTLTETVESTQDPWLAGMPIGSTASDTDSVTANSVRSGSTPSNGYDSASTMNVTPGSTITWQSVSGEVSHLTPPDYYGPDGQTDNVYWHLKDGSYTEPEGDGGQNGIGDVQAPIDSMIGVFLDNDAPNASDNTNYANYANDNMRSYTTDYDQSSAIDNIHLQQPFYIGNGTNSSGASQSFVVPANATRLFIGMMDGYQWANNAGSFTVTAVEQPPIETVQ